jgi:Fe2+ transport system protein FeoA
MVAPLGDPISIKIGNYLLSLRKEEANAVLVSR